MGDEGEIVEKWPSCEHLLNPSIPIPRPSISRSPAAQNAAVAKFQAHYDVHIAPLLPLWIMPITRSNYSRNILRLLLHFISVNTSTVIYVIKLYYHMTKSLVAGLFICILSLNTRSEN